MTREEAAKALSLMEHVESIAAVYEPGERREDITVRKLKKACRMASEALRTQQAHTKLYRSRWEGCEWCIGFCPNVTGDPHWNYKFCPMCGRPITKEAWAELEWKIGRN